MIWKSFGASKPKGLNRIAKVTYAWKRRTLWSIYISQLIHYSRACGSYRDVFGRDRGLLLTSRLLNQGFISVKLKSLLLKSYDSHHDLFDRYGMSVKNDQGYVPLAVSTSRSFSPSLLITGFVTRLTRRVSLVEQ